MQATQSPQLGRASHAQQIAPSAAGLLSSTKGILESLDLGAMLERLAQALGSFLQVDGLSLKLLGMTEELLLVRRKGSFKQEMIFGSRVMAPASFAWEAIQAGGPTILQDIHSTTKFTFPSYVSREGFSCLVAVPLMAGQLELGLVTIYL